jgi:hypothetical protein
MSDTTVPPILTGTRFSIGEDLLSELRTALAARDVQYGARHGALNAMLAPQADRLENLQADGHPMGCSDQIRLELQWLVSMVRRCGVSVASTRRHDHRRYRRHGKSELVLRWSARTATPVWQFRLHRCDLFWRDFRQ